MISVIIPIYNKFPHLDRSVDSVLNQDFEDFELILVDDGSSDGSYEKALSFNDDRIKVFQRGTPGPGGYAARNLGISKAKFDWIAFLDADDAWKPNHLATFSDLIDSKPDISIVSTSWTDVFDGKDSSKSFDSAYHRKHQTKGVHEIDLESFLVNSRDGFPPFWTGALGIRKSLLESISGFPEGRCKRGGDVDTWLRAIYWGKLALWSPQKTVIYHRDSVNMVTKTQVFELGCEADTVKLLAEKAESEEVKSLLFQFLNSRVVSRWLQTLRVGQKPGSLWGKTKWRHLNFKGRVITLVSIFPPEVTAKAYRVLSRGKYD
ncbi:glycosyltransferase family A protein [Cyclobacterium plantarum]|uniref:Glycosyltransferase family 2 protein n=1 Tax=Cyclobacterium plantarum TaxID=2716263 RepID=A0ABX0H2H1_9BACT|nr:glycosyltransferase family A protein [Cyclobacterium plantarum]NHE55630.1 glycosyltransferase family 2 protein [Cyclobacterium plantarum]